MLVYAASRPDSYCQQPLTPPMRSVQSLARSLLQNEFGEQGANAIVDVAKGKAQLASLCGIKPEETERDFSGWGLTASDAVLLAFDLQKQTTLTSLKCAATRQITHCQ